MKSATILSRSSTALLSLLPLLGGCASDVPPDEADEEVVDADASELLVAQNKVVNPHNIRIRYDGLVVGVASASTADGANVVQWNNTNAPDQQWYFLKNADGSYTIKNRNSLKCLDVNGASQSDGASVIQWTCKGTANQKWIATHVSDGYYTLKASHSNKCLDLSGPSNAPGTKLQQYTCWNGTNQQFRVPNQASQTRFVGNIGQSSSIPANFDTYWNQITPENAGKWEAVEPQRDVMKWDTLDAIHDYAVAHGMPFKQHTFVWGSQQPAWISALPLAEQKAEVEEWISAFCTRYPDVALIDVVNEPPPHSHPSYMAALGGAGQTGYDWIITAFKMARKHCPKATLILSDYHVLSTNTDHFVSIVNAVKGSGYIDALGEQAHDLEGVNINVIKAQLNKVLATGLPLYITEYDINKSNDAEQNSLMQSQFKLFWNTDRVFGITFWGYIHGKTWKPNANLLYSNGTRRPAMDWLYDNYL